MKTRLLLCTVVALIVCSFYAGAATAWEERTGERLLAAAEGLQMPSSEADSAWRLVSYTGVKGLPEADAFGETSGCPQGGTTRLGFDETLARLSKVEPWMDDGQVRSARGFGKLGKVFGREFGEDLAIYRCETGGAEVNIYFVGADDDHLTGLLTISIET